ncbi:MAG: hypothetical protein ACE5KQ_04710 [Thermoplasmata archaeon]
MSRYLRTVLHQDVAVAAAGNPIETNLGVNPISFLLITLRAQVLAANINPTLANLLAVFSSVDVRFKGTSIVSLSLADLFRMAAALWGRFPITSRISDPINETTTLTIPLPFARVPYWMNEAFPASRSGDLVLSLTIAAAFTNITGVTVQVEQIELLDAVPDQFLKYTTFNKTPTATGEHDTDLPLGNPIPGVLLFGTTVPTGTSFNASIGTLKLLVDNVENFYSLANWESLHNDFIIRAFPEWDLSTELHRLAAAGVYAANDISQGPASVVRVHDTYAYLDFDPLRDNNYLLETEGRGRVHLRINADVADAIRILPVEIIRLPGAERPAQVI